MKIFYNKNKLLSTIRGEKDLGFVPTMGSIHKGHVFLINNSKRKCNKTIVTIYINKPQFNKIKDYENYPRNLKKDIKILKKNRVDFLYLPTSREIYPFGPNKKIKINPFGKKLCGKFRPNHFASIVDVMDRFIKIINPKKIFMGEKDLQQLLIMRDFIKKNKIRSKVIACKTVRNKDGVALSSRNMLLFKNEIKNAAKIYNLIKKNKINLLNKKITLETIKEQIFKFGVSKIDYLEILNINNLIEKTKKNKKYKIFISYYFRSTRLIDNI